jgi:hypothetical protein
MTAIRELHDGKSRPGTVLPPVSTHVSLQGSQGSFSAALEEAKILEYTWQLQPPYVCQ